jgi:hypothetical protein
MHIGAKIAVLVVACAVGAAIVTTWNDLAAPVLGSELAVANVNGGNADWQSINFFHKYKGWVSPIVGLLIAGLIAALTWPRKRKDACHCGKDGTCNRDPGGIVPGVMCLPIMLLALSLATTGCRKYDTPEYVTVKPCQTAYVLPLEGDSKVQAKFDSAAYLETRKVASKRIQIPHRWNKEGYWYNDGAWLPTVAAILVDRSPVTREWKSDGVAGKDGAITKGRDNAIWVESADSVGFSMGISCTAFIKEEDTSTFLYWYPSGSLAEVMDLEVRARVQQVAGETSAKYKLDVLREKKQELIDNVRSNALPFFATRGITITTLGMFGGMTYENGQIQDAIDQTFINQQAKVNATALLEAQSNINERIKSEASAEAAAAVSRANGEAEGLNLINQALAKAANNPQLVQLRQLEVEAKRIDRWNGVYPNSVAGDGANVWVGLGASASVPAVAAKP